MCVGVKTLRKFSNSFQFIKLKVYETCAEFPKNVQGRTFRMRVDRDLWRNECTQTFHFPSKKASILQLLNCVCHGLEAGSLPTWPNYPRFPRPFLRPIKCLCLSFSNFSGWESRCLFLSVSLIKQFVLSQVLHGSKEALSISYCSQNLSWLMISHQAWSRLRESIGFSSRFFLALQ